VAFEISRRFSRQTKLSDLADSTLLTLARLGEGMSEFLFDMVVIVLNLRAEFNSSGLNSDMRLKILDVTIFLGDQFRWECMRRLGWVHGFPGETYPLVDLIVDSDKIKSEYRPAVSSPGDGSCGSTGIHSLFGNGHGSGHQKAYSPGLGRLCLRLKKMNKTRPAGLTSACPEIGDFLRGRGRR
jgi:hypothetical protein